MRGRRLGGVLGKGRSRFIVAVLTVAGGASLAACGLSGASAPAGHPGTTAPPGSSPAPASAVGTGRAMPTLQSYLGPLRFPGSMSLPFPPTGESAVYIPGLGVVGASPDQRPRPIASETKVMTALIVLRDHPLSGSDGGPVFTMTMKDKIAWLNAAENDDSNVMVEPGERIDERQLLEALLVPSADNAADYLARWDAGSIASFVAKMNAEAAALGLARTRYVDPSGVSPGNVSTAVEQAVLAGVAMANPTLRWIVDHASLSLPVAGRVWNYNPAIGTDGIVGVKSGFIQASQACLVTAAWRSVGSRRILVISSTLDQPLGLGEAALVDEALLEAASAKLVSRTLLVDGQVVGRAVARWDGRTSALRVSGLVTAVGWPGLVLQARITPRRPGTGTALAAGSPIALLRLVGLGGTVTAADLVLDRALPAAPSGWPP